MRKYPTKKLAQETKAIIRLYLFLRHNCGLMYADKLTAKDLAELLRMIERPRERGIIKYNCKEVFYGKKEL